MKKNYEEKLPKIEDINDKYPKKLFFGIFALFYLIYYCGITKYILNELNIFKNITYLGSIIMSISFLVIMELTIIVLFWSRIKRDAKLLIKNFKTYFKYNIHIFARYFWIYILATIGIVAVLYKMGIVTPESTNEQNLQQVPTGLVFVLAIFSAPILEEGMFRWIIRKITDNKWVYILISGFLFGLIHVNYWGNQELYQVIFIFQYAILGMMMAESYYNTNNLLASSLLHASWNFVMMILQIMINLR